MFVIVMPGTVQIKMLRFLFQQGNRGERFATCYCVGYYV